MRGQKHLRAWWQGLLSITVLACVSCGGVGGQQQALDPAQGTTPAPADVDLGPQFPSLPALPTGADDPVQPREVSANFVDNFENGNTTIKTSSQAVFVNGTGLDMGPAGVHKNGWAIWRWGAFQVIAGQQNEPRQVKTDISITGTNQYWIALSDYSKNKWQVFGPNKTGAATFTLSPGENYLSGTKNCYVALLVTDNFKFTVNKLDLLADNDTTPPGPPTSVSAVNITPHGATIKWTAPSDPDLSIFKIYIDTTNPFVDTDPPKAVTPDKNTTVVPITGLFPSTTYYVHVVSVDTPAGNVSVDSNTATFTTKANGPPVPAFVYNPTPVGKNVPTTFDPSSTTDPDDPPANLTCKWDWDNNGTDDDVYTGLGTIQHPFPNKGTVTVKLTVSDAPDGSGGVSTTQSILIGSQLETRDTGSAQTGPPILLKMADTDYATGRMAAIVQPAGPTHLLMFQGGTVTGIDFNATMLSYTLDAVALAPGGKVGVLMIDPNAANLSWYIFETDGTSWTQAHTGTNAQKVTSGGALAYGSNGTFSVALTHSATPSPPNNPSYTLTVYHEKADSSLISSDGFTGTFPPYPFSLRRSDSQTVCVYAKSDPSGQIANVTVTDSGGSNSNQQSFAGVAQQVITGTDPADATHVFWAARSDNGKIYFGDNYGTANGAQTYTPSRTPNTLLGVGLAGDNKGLFYWADTDANLETWIRGYNTGTSALFEPLHGAGLCDAGFGGWFNNGTTDGVYLVTAETRDGALTGYLMNGATIAQQDSLMTPPGGQSLGDQSVAFITNGGGFTVLNRQQSPIALMHTASSVGGPFTTSQLGFDTYANPDCAASGTMAGDLLLGTQYNATNVIVYHFPPAATTGTYVATISGASQAKMFYNPTLNQTGVLYDQNSKKNLAFRIWDGTTLGSPVTVYSGSAAVVDMVLKARPDGQWGAAWDDNGNNVRMAETSSGTWQTANTLSTSGLNLPIGSLGMEYASNGDAGLAVERSAGGLWFGLKASGSGTATWTQADSSSGFDISSINVHFLLGTTPTVLYHAFSGGIKMAQDNAGVWSASSLAFYINASPIVSVMDAAGTLAVVGKDSSTGESAVCFLSQ